MQKPTAYGASVLVLVLLLVLTQTGDLMIFAVQARDQHKRACLPPASDGQYSLDYNTASLLALEPSKVQDLVLGTVSIQLTNGFTQGPDEFCSGKKTYSAVAGDYIGLFSYAYCSVGVDLQRCTDCLQGGAQVIRDYCPNSCDGAQASSIDCCIRFERYKFCKAT
ncbi:hypothetical protein LINGRAHAP2_LOCUS12164 [Linum grandiflorum]